MLQFIVIVINVKKRDQDIKMIKEKIAEMENEIEKVSVYSKQERDFLNFRLQGYKEALADVRELIENIKRKYHTHQTANFSDTMLFGLDEGLNEILEELE